MYPASLDVPDDARPRGDPAPAQGPQPHADRARAPRERQPVDDRQDREAADESLVRRRAADHELPPGRDEEAGEESARGPDSDAEGPVRRGEAAPADGGRRDATLEVLSDARHAQRPSGRLDLGQGDQQPDPERPGPERPRADPRRRGHGARVPPGRLEGPGRARREPVAPLQRGPRDHAGRGHGHRHEVGPHEAPLSRRSAGGLDSRTPALSLNNDNSFSRSSEARWQSVMIGCGYCVKTVRKSRYLYFWHYEDRGGRREQIEEYVGPVNDAEAREQIARRVA